MDEDNAILTIESAQWEGNDRPEAVRLTTEGRMVRLEDAWVFLYRESPESGMTRTTTTIRVADDGSVSLVRQGDAVMRMHFSEGQQHLTSMTTPYGIINVGLSTHRVASRITEEGGEIDLSYTIDFGNQHNMNTRIHVDVRRTGS
ncbi:MAG: DUF1934 domain-containing protein [Clostridia bacterium]|nr:DUF1934 domain-containing protein [Clostridia bacterium]